jgi:hypothetical protein
MKNIIKWTFAILVVCALAFAGVVAEGGLDQVCFSVRDTGATDGFKVTRLWRDFLLHFCMLQVAVRLADAFLSSLTVEIAKPSACISTALLYYTTIETSHHAVNDPLQSQMTCRGDLGTKRLVHLRWHAMAIPAQACDTRTPERQDFLCSDFGTI